jgi:hypothetical protein
VAWRTAFDVAEAGYQAWPFLLPGAAFVVFGLAAVSQPARLQRILPSALKGRLRQRFGLVFLVFAVLWTATSFAQTWSEYRRAVAALVDGHYEVAEGAVRDFVPMPYGGHSMESFKVAGTSFSYSDYVITAGFHTTASHGGPLQGGMTVRIAHVGNLILRLEIAGEE